MTNEEKLEIRVARLEERLAAAEAARRLAVDAVDVRLASMNEMRDQLAGERGQYITRDWADHVHSEQDRRLDQLEKMVAEIEGGNRIKAATIGWGIAAMAVVLTVVVVLLNVLTTGSP